MSLRNHSLYHGAISESSWSENISSYQLFSNTKSRMYIHMDEPVTKILASLLPDEIIYNSEANTELTYEGSVLFADVSGFTDLCEKYSSIGKGGPSRLTQVLNGYIGALVQEIMSHRGDVLKFSGDAFLAFWRSNEYASMPEVVHAALDCALNIQKTHGSYKTEVGVQLRVKIAISAGISMFSVIGDSNFMIVGNPIWDVKDSGNMCKAGDIIISNVVTSYVNIDEYVVEILPARTHMRVLGIGPTWSPVQYSNQYEIFDNVSSVMTKSEKRHVEFDETESASYQSESSIIEDDADPDLYGNYELRPSLDYAASRNLKDYLRKFIIPPVMRVIDQNEPMEYLTEMRQVVIVFINIVVTKVSLKNFIYIADTMYRIICTLVQSKEGCVNKVSMFDKDLMFLVIFGLRGFKHVLEAQRALHCAREIIDAISTMPKVESASIGVTSGMTYCGVVGHPLRREYTVIGRTVNKAARIMVAYPNKVTCDRQTYVHSKLASRYFTLQEYKPLKGFTSVGPIYEFKESEESDLLVLRLQRNWAETSKHPLLGRQKEINLYFNLMDDAIDRRGTNVQYDMDDASTLLSATSDISKNYSSDTQLANIYYMLAIYGDPRQGKTRLLHEIIYKCPTSYKIISFGLNKKDMKIQYKAVRYIFTDRLKLIEETNIEARTKRFGQALSNMMVPEFICGLNDIMDVNFPVTKYYKRLNENQMQKVKFKLVYYLLLRCFKEKSEKYVIVIDNANYIDDDSLDIISVLFEKGLAFFVLTINSCIKLSEKCRDLLCREGVKSITLEPINKWYHSALICQFLGVRGVPLELEKHIQNHSDGNPGWIESFLTTLQHSGTLDLFQTTHQYANDYGFVVPPVELIFRMEIGPSITADNIFNRARAFESRTEGWDIYQHTFEDSFDYEVLRVPRLHKDSFFVCVLPKDVCLEDANTEDALDTKMMRTYDSLTLQEQLLLKSSSTLGDLFTRNMLEYVTQGANARKMGLAISKLFEMHVFTCARGVLKEGHITINHQLTDPNQDFEVKCECEGFEKNPICADLPKYASCGYLRFRESKFRQMLYNLLTDNQMKQCHTRAVWYLENETQRCLSCKGGYFVMLNGQVNDDGMKSYLSDQERAFPENHDSIHFALSFDNLTHNEHRYTDVKLIDEGHHSDLIVRLAKNSRRRTVFKHRNMKGEERTRSFVDINLKDCECPLILATVYSCVIRHCEEAATPAMNKKLMYALLEYARISVQAVNVTLSLQLLEKATTLLEEKLANELSEPSWQIPMFRGRIKTLQGQLWMKRGFLDIAEMYLMEALRCYNLKFPSVRVDLKLRTKREEIKQKLVLTRFANYYIGTADDDASLLADQTFCAMSALFKLYKKTNRFAEAYLAAMWGLNIALKSDSNFFNMVNAYTNVIAMNSYKSNKLIPKIEEYALRLCFRKQSRLEIHEFQSVIKMYGAIFIRRFLSLNIESAMNIGFLVVELNTTFWGGSYRWLMLPLLQKALVLTCHFEQAVQFLQQLKYLSQDPADTLAPKMFYTMCVDLKLDTTYCIVPFDEAEQFIINKLSNRFRRTVIGGVEIKYYLILWLWYIRRRMYNQALNLYYVVQHVDQHKDFIDEARVMVCLRLLEGCLLIYVRLINDRDVDRAETLKDEKIIPLLKKLNVNSSYFMCFRPRFCHLKAYWCMINNKREQAMRLLDEAIYIGQHYSCIYEIQFIEYSREGWLSEIPYVFENDPWIIATNVDNSHIDWRDYMLKMNGIFPFFFYFLPQEQNKTPRNTDVSIIDDPTTNFYISS